MSLSDKDDGGDDDGDEDAKRNDVSDNAHNALRPR
jgi:hypothetical protein